MNHSRDFLIEFASKQELWLKALIYETIETNGKINEEKIDQILESIITNKCFGINVPRLSETKNQGEIKLTELEHISGINALKSAQTIKFSKDVTILYGLNGAGKSSYFKILNEIIGGNQKKELLKNIYSDQNEEINVQISYTINDKQKDKIQWKGDKRSIEPLNALKVFDTSYMNELLDVRTTDKTLLQPFGLNLFTYLVSQIDKLKSRLIEKATALKSSKPDILTDSFSDEVKKCFFVTNLTEKQAERIEQLYGFDKEQELQDLSKKLENLKQINIDDKITIKKTENDGYKNLKDKIQNSINKLESAFSTYNILLKDYQIYKEESRKNKEQLTVLENIPALDSTEWKCFIKQADIYSQKIENSNKKCIYCLQSLNNEKSIELVKAYGLFLNNKSEKKFENVNKEIETKINELQQISVDFALTNCADNSIFNEIQILETRIKEIKERILNTVITRQYAELMVDFPSSYQIIEFLNSRIERNVEEISLLTSNKEKKDTEIMKTQLEISKLNENKSIHLQQYKIKEWININTNEMLVRTKESSLSTNKITMLSNIVHDKLITNTLAENFNEELKLLGYEKLNVKIEKAGASKGSINTKLAITKNNRLNAVFSEGEQKAISLSLFIAEARMQKTSNPIIFDDPVNSLDHEIAEKFAHRLLSLNNQIIIFNHNKLFLDAFEGVKNHHVCKSGDSDCSTREKGKHIRIYNIKSEGRCAKGVISHYKGTRPEDYLNEVKKMLKKSPFEENKKAASLLRNAVESCIDEVVFQKQTPTKYSNKNSRINWDTLKKIKNDSALIDKLHEIHGRTSGGELHNGTENEENPIKYEEIEAFVKDLEDILEKNKIQ